MVYIVAKPSKPSSAPVRIQATSTKTVIDLTMPSVTGTSTGGLTLTSYKLEWNGGGTGSTFTPLQGDAPLSTV